ncbi:type I restriction endonuclease subunit R [Nostoc sp. TCL26-01]|uniref:type I restriction endonuclease subunit R n=1 Tax=Nostoc sp. TCL26-01 TaxID=2576904 RepID=UPI0015BEA4B9|nr:type I restriction endonuclease subunit R [Nostoc sp. TCL26-01]QLE55453.1 type I restriction endonuclease subunit R [Nostoc sp. TCL26-01]
MIQTLAISQAIGSLAIVEEKFGLVESSDEQFCTEWWQNLLELNDVEKQALDRLKQRFVSHKKRGQLSEGAVDRLLVSPLLDLAGLYEPRFVIDTEASVEVLAEDEDELYRGRIDVLVVEHRLWVLVVEEKATRIDMETALPQALAYMVASPSLEKPVFGLATNGNRFAFIKLQQRDRREYAFSDSFSLLSHQNKLYDVLQILKHIGNLIVGN